MTERRYEVLQGNNRLATDMQLEDALLFIHAFFDKYYMEHSMIISIKEMDRTEGETLPYEYDPGAREIKE